jgi:hypothetical protein
MAVNSAFIESPYYYCIDRNIIYSNNINKNISIYLLSMAFKYDLMTDHKVRSSFKTTSGSFVLI